MRLRSKLAVITGANKGMGTAPVRLLAAEGVGVLVCDLGGSPGLEAAEEIAREGGEARFAITEVKHDAEVADAMRTARHTFERIDVLTNVAETDRERRVDSPAAENWSAVMEVHV